MRGDALRRSYENQPMSKFDPQKHHRRSIRLKGYDYSSEGAYYVTIVTYHRDCLFGEVVNEEMVLNDFGKIADECWRAIPEHFPNVDLGVHVIMPNHAHGILVIRIDESRINVGVDPVGPPLPRLARAPRDRNRIRWGQSLGPTNPPFRIVPITN
jgi:hypothetical protein